MSFIKEYGKHFESSSGATPEWNAFFLKAKEFFTEALKEISMGDMVIYKGHFYFSGFFTAKTGQVYYFSISDVRFFPGNHLLIRKARDFHDYAGATNHYLPVNKDLPAALKKFVKV
jgi:hypothetical protein